MTTAHRPTWRPAVASTNSGYNTFGAVSGAYSARDLPGQLKLKSRQPGQGTAGDVASRDLRAELEARERKHFEEHRKPAAALAEEEKKVEDKLLLTDSAEASRLKEQFQRLDQDEADEDSEASDDSSDDEESEGDEDDEEQELLRELEKIKKEREEERLRQEQLKREEEEKAQKEAMLQSNPLLAGPAAASARVKRRWDDDVVFRNQAKAEPQAKKRFINDTVRSDFHRKFMRKYIK